MLGVPSPEYVAAGSVLLDALAALQDQRDAVILVGAQAIYLHTGEAEFAVAEYTTDGDIALDPSRLRDAPTVEEAMARAGFVRDPLQPGRWRGRGEVQIDLLVPAALGGGGRRGARLGVHGTRAARKARGLEAALVDRTPARVGTLEDNDARSFEVMVAGPSALLVAKLHKLGERRDSAERLLDKDALDAFRLLRAIATDEIAEGFHRLLDDDRSRGVTEVAIGYLSELFGTPDDLGCLMAARALVPLEDPAEIAAACSALAGDLLSALGRVR